MSVNGEGDFHNKPMIIMAFLPQNNIDKISKATIKLLEKNNVIPEYEIITILSGPGVMNKKSIIYKNKKYYKENISEIAL